MRQVKETVILGVVLIAVGLPATANDAGDLSSRRLVYVRQTVGDDENDGLSPGTAWRSLSRLEDAMRAGYTAYVGPGLYREKVTLSHSGTAKARITLIADATGEHTGDPPGVVMITGADAVDEKIFVPQPSPGLYMAPNSGARIVGAVEMDGPQYRYTAAYDTKEHLREGMSELDVVARLPGTFFYDLDADTLYIHTSDARPPHTHEIELIRRYSGFEIRGKHYVSVIGFTLRHWRVAGINFAGASHGIALDNTTYGSWQGIRATNSTNIVVGGNTAFRNGNSGVYFLSEALHGYALGNVLYENAKGVRWSSGSANGLAFDNVAFANHEVGISIENADDIVVGRNVLAKNAVAQLSVMKSRYVSQSNCFESGPDQLIAKVDFHGRYRTLEAYMQASGQDLGSRESCGRLPRQHDVHELHAETQAYAERARKLLAGDREPPGEQPD